MADGAVPRPLSPRARLLPALLTILALRFAVAPRVAVQEATPAAGGEAMPPGVSAAYLAYAPVTALPPMPGAIALFRLTFQPGADLPPDPTDPSAAFALVEAGEITVHSTEPLMVGRAAAGTPSAETQTFEQVPAGTDATLRVGDSLYGGPHAPIELRNDGTAPAVLLVAAISPGGEAAGTPTP